MGSQLEESWDLVGGALGNTMEAAGELPPAGLDLPPQLRLEIPFSSKRKRSRGNFEAKRKEGRMGREELGFLPQFYHQSVAWLWIN